MAITPRLDLRQSQSLVMTPQLQQAIKLLQLSNIELSAYVEDELLQNPMLEREESSKPGDDSASQTADGGDAEADDMFEPESLEHTATETMPTDGDSALDIDGDSVWTEDGPGDTVADNSDADGTIDDMANMDAIDSVDTSALDGTSTGLSSTVSGGSRDFSERVGDLEATLSDAPTLRDHLTEQLLVDIADPGDRLIGIQLIETLDESGWISEPLEQIAERLNCGVDRVTAILELLQRFDPPGLFARDLRECLALQLRDLDRLDPAMQALLDNLDLLAKHDKSALLRVCGVDDEDLTDMVAEIRALNPKPAQAFDHEITQTVTPDILMRPHPDGGWTIELNPETLPRVLVNVDYFSRVRKATRKKEEREYINECFQSANWLVKSLHQRATTILKVASEITRQQDAFFRKGIAHMKPLVLRDIAEEIEMHESTVSRVTTNKYMHTPRGIFELKYFFSAAIANTGGGDAHSAEAVRFRIKSLIDAESTDEILSDDRIVEILKQDGIDIARRTVAKYREALKIPSSVQRRRQKRQQL